MELYQAIAARYSVRSFKNAPIEDDKLQRILEAGRVSPSARNRQERKVIVVRDEKLRGQLANAAGQPFLAEAPVVLAMVGLTPDAQMTCRVPTDPVDCAIAIDHMVLAAVAEGLGACWVGRFDQDLCRRILDVPESAWIIELVPMGYPATPPKTEKNRKPMDQFVCYDRLQ